MSDRRELPRTPDEVAAFMNNLTFEPPPSSEQEEEEEDLLASLPPAGSEVMVVRSLRLPLEVDEAVAAAAREAGVPKTAWIRQAIEMALASQSEADEPISRAEAVRALTLLRPVRRAA
ncbi:MAG: ribbon-helix-helix protein, CopG family [Micromonosporaceae bacterium]